MKKLKTYKASCILCNHVGEHGEEVCDCIFTATDHYRQIGKYKRVFVSGEKIVTTKLENHYEENHLDVILDVWMNNQSSDAIEVIETSG